MTDHIGRRIVAARRDAGLKSAAALAERVADKTISQSVIQNVEAGRKRDLTVHELVEIARAIGVTPAYLAPELDFDSNDFGAELYEQGYRRALEDMQGFVKSRSQRRAASNTATPAVGLGEKVRALREAAELTQAEVAQLMQEEGFSWYQATVYKIEAGRRKLPGSEVRALANALGVEPSALI